VKGEMRNLSTGGDTSPLFGWIISARTDIKQDNFRTERDLISYAEPLAVFSAMLGLVYPQAFVDKAYNWLLQNHGHDSIGGCSRDIISEDMLFRSRQSREISACVTENALKAIAGSIKIDKEKRRDVAMIAYNPSAFKRSQITRAYLLVPNDWEGEGIEITDAQNNKVEFDIVGKDDSYYQVVQSPNDCANSFLMSRYQIDLRLEDIPSMGYKTFFVKPAGRKRNAKGSMITGPTTMENEFICVTIKHNGTLTILDKETGTTYDNQGYFKDSSEIGNPWEHEAVENEQVLSTIEVTASIELIKDTAFEASFEVTIDWKLPKGRSEDEKNRSPELVEHRIINTVSLKQGQRWVEVETNFENKAEDHYLRVCFDSGIDTDKVHVQGQFDVVERSLEKIDYSIFDEAPQPENPMNSFIDLSDGHTGLALLNDGLKAYEVMGDEDKTMCLTLLRSFPLRICVTPLEMTDYSNIDNSSQCLGEQTFRYGVMPHKGDWQQANLWQTSEKFNLPMLLTQIAPTEHGTGPLEKSFLELEIENLHVSAVKKSEDGDGWCVRLFNQGNEIIKNKIRLNSGNANPSKTKSPVEAIKSEFAPATTESKWSDAREVTLEELAGKDLSIDSEGWVDFEIGAKQILTIEFLP
jgi:alpha-mannosidase